MPPNDAVVVCYVVRHGVTSLNKDKRFRGNANPELAPQGIKEAHKLASLFGPIEISHIFCSDKHRATRTAEIIAEAKGVPIHKSEQLRALDVGNFSGQKRTPEAESDLQKYLDQPEVTIPGGESLQNFKDRIAPCLQQAVNLYCECGVPPLLVCHSSIIHEVGALLMGGHKNVLVEPGGAVAIYSRNGKLSAEPIYRPLKVPPSSHAGTIT